MIAEVGHAEERGDEAEEEGKEFEKKGEDSGHDGEGYGEVEGSGASFGRFGQVAGLGGVSWTVSTCEGNGPLRTRRPLHYRTIIMKN